MEYKGANNHERTENLLHGPCKKEDPEKAVRTPFYQTESTGGSVWVIKPVRHCKSTITTIPTIYGSSFRERNIPYPQPNEEVPFKKGHVIVSKKDSCHGAKNTGDEDIIFVSIVAPVPSDYDPINEWQENKIPVWQRIVIILEKEKCLYNIGIHSCISGDILVRATWLVGYLLIFQLVSIVIYMVGCSVVICFGMHLRFLRFLLFGVSLSFRLLLRRDLL